MRLFVWCYFAIAFCSTRVHAQQQTAPPSANNVVPVIAPAAPTAVSVLDSVVQATRAREKFLADSVAMQYIKYPDSALTRQFIAQTLKDSLYTGLNFLDIHVKKKGVLKEGTPRQTRDPWIMVSIAALLLYTVLLNLTINKDIRQVFLSFYGKRSLFTGNNEDTHINFWSFVGLFLLFGFTLGLFIYQCTSYNNRYYPISGANLFIFLSVIILALSAVKFVVLKLIGFIFDINKLVSEYVSVLYLTYFNMAFVFLPVVICFSLLNGGLIPFLLWAAILLLVIIFMWLYLRSSVNIISNFRFHKFYLFIYLCALEICPILILIKALNI